MAFSGGADSTALLVLAGAAELTVTAHHVDHGLRPSAHDDAVHAAELAAELGVGFELHTVDVGAGTNLEARARTARYAALPDGAMTGHTADDQAETLLLNLVRGAGLDGLSAMTPGHRRPLLALRRAETRALCDDLGLRVVDDPSNTDPAIRRNRVRHELLPLLDSIGARDVVPILARTADVLRADRDALDGLADQLDPTDALALLASPVAVAKRALRRWLIADGYAPDAAAVERVWEVVSGVRVACELSGGRRIERSRQRLRVTALRR